LCNLEPIALTKLIDSYSQIEGTLFEDVLKQGYASVVKATYFEDCLDKGIAFQDRKSIPTDRVYTGEEAAALWKQHGNCFLVVISYSWLSIEHPDPDMFHLRRLVPFLRNLRDEFRTATGCRQDLGIIIDYCSLYQNMSAAVPEEHQDYHVASMPSNKWSHESRTSTEKQSFKKGIISMNTAYAHQDITAIKLTETPENETRTYDLRGWPFFESKVIDCKGTSTLPQSKGYKMKDKWGEPRSPDNPGAWNVFVLVGSEREKLAVDVVGCRSEREPPCNSSRFRQELAKRQKLAEERNVCLFTTSNVLPNLPSDSEEAKKGEDKEFEEVASLYDKIFRKFTDNVFYDSTASRAPRNFARNIGGPLGRLSRGSPRGAGGPRFPPPPSPPPPPVLPGCTAP
jgi:hypothetical protein